MRPKGCPLTPQEACAQNIDTALREWFNHGRDVYEARRQQMREVAVKADISHMCTLLDDTYEDRVADWKHKYADGPEPEIKGLSQFDVQSDVEDLSACAYVSCDASVEDTDVGNWDLLQNPFAIRT